MNTKITTDLIERGELIERVKRCDSIIFSDDKKITLSSLYNYANTRNWKFDLYYAYKIKPYPDIWIPIGGTYEKYYFYIVAYRTSIAFVVKDYFEAEQLAKSAFKCQTQKFYINFLNSMIHE